ncbi:predicted protein [Naegleria gruberi]|uniref:Predicted protein n=1 Tax=Naegleria gruberi TaxID=5762 RepID=D2VY50_NAEGR|nr:uncharacterized protein NAEGRDRAFT_73972 [Naegleria gruberi]EFC38303.1 predicted protein [Naegleria gruberi]|eukprot:XP_002671047.1 predicted protein [Naegleria gruberi strain NEG-M]
MPITFTVSTKKPNEVSLPAFEIKQILPDPTKTKEKFTLVKSSCSSSPDFLTVGNNSFIHSAILAYSEHHNLVIRPDDVWIAIATQFANYVNSKSEELRSKFVDFDGKKELVVVGGGTLFTADCADLTLRMTEQIAKNIKDPSVRDWIMPDFSTTTNLEKMVGAVVLMSTTKNYFDYKYVLRCGLPSVTLLGEKEDWQNLYERAKRLIEFDTKAKLMKKWSDMLLPVLEQFVKSASGNPDTKWWNRIAHVFGGGSGPTYISGWIGVFSAFSDAGVWRGDVKSAKDVKSEWPIMDMQDISRGYVSVPVTVDDNGTIYKTELYAGHMCARLHNNSNDSIIPRVDWALFVKQ